MQSSALYSICEIPKCEYRFDNNMYFNYLMQTINSSKMANYTIVVVNEQVSGQN